MVEASGVLRVAPLDARHDAERDALVRSSKDGGFFHLAGWRRAVVKCFGHEPRDLGAWRGERLVGVLPLFACKRPFKPATWVSTAYAVYGGPCALDAEAEAALVRVAVEAARAAGAARLELRRRTPLQDDAGLARHELYATFRKEIPAAREEILARMPKKARAEARKGVERHGLELLEGAGHLEELVRLFAANKKSLGSPTLPRRWFEALLEELGADGGVRIHAVRRKEGGETLAACMSFVFRDEFDYYYLGATDAANRQWSVSNYLPCALQEWCFDQGLATFDFGRSRVDSGPHRFKEHQGFEPAPLAYRVALLKDKQLPSFHPGNAETERLRKLWTRLPDWATNAASGMVMRWLP